MFSEWLSKLMLPESSGSWTVPKGAHVLTSLVYRAAPLFAVLSRLESWAARFDLEDEDIEVRAPVYICGIARAGTTITLEVLHRHPDAATHRYYNIPLPTLPIWGTRIIQALPLEDAGPIERIHADRLRVNKDSPEGLEERLWMSYFDHLHDEGQSNLLDAATDNPAFERFYRDHIRKLLLVQRRSRYIVKNNYNVTRLGYLQKLNPSARFLIIVRDPVAHIASLTKQHRLFNKLCTEDPRLQENMAIIGHFEFGPGQAFINVGRPEQLERVKGLWDQGRQVEGWAVYWSSIYGHLADQLQTDAAIARASLVVRYEDLCRDSGATIDGMLAHIDFDPEPFAETRRHFVETLTEPTYYSHGFSDDEVAAIRTLTADVAARFGYDSAC